MTIANGHIQNKGKVRYPDFEHSCVGLASSGLFIKPKEMTIGNSFGWVVGLPGVLGVGIGNNFYYSKNRITI